MRRSPARAAAHPHLVTGHGIEHERLEADLAQFTGRQRALLFSTGYMANLAAVTCLAQRDSRIVMDRLSHASLIDAARLSGATLKRFAHADAQAAQVMLQRAAAPGVNLLVTDGVFSMDGDLAPLPQLAQAAAQADATLLVDDAHGLGVMGATGRGSVEHFDLDSTTVPILIGTLGKAFGCLRRLHRGGCGLHRVAAAERAQLHLHDSVAATGRGPPPARRWRVASRDSWRRERVLALAARLRRGAAQAGVPLLPSLSPIQPVVLGDSARALAVSETTVHGRILGRGHSAPDRAQSIRAVAHYPVGGTQRAAGRCTARGARGGAARHPGSTACSRLTRSCWTGARCVRHLIVPAPRTMRPRYCRRACVMNCCHGST